MCLFRSESLIASEWNILSPNSGHIVRMFECVVVIDTEVQCAVTLAEIELCRVQLEERAGVAEAYSDNRVLDERITNQRAYLERVTFRIDIIDNQQLVFTVRMS